MELRVLSYFLAVAREQSIVRAAKSLHLSQPTLSTQIKAMEEELGKQLLIRGTKGTRKVTLTEEGMILRKRCLLYTSVFLSYEREAYYSLDGSDFRVTFDENILYRRKDFSLGSELYGVSLLDEDQTLMEIKTSGGIPLWMSETLTKHHLYKTSRCV